MHIIEEEEKHKYAGFWVRFVASIIDGVVLFFIDSLVSLLFFQKLVFFMSPDNFGDDYLISPDFLLFNFFSLAIGLIYYAGMQSSSKQATIGKMAFDIKVVRTDGSRISFLRGVGRYFSKWVSAVILMIGYIMAAFDSRKQALHDKIADTMNVYDPS